jgi:hypothetical protein
MQENALIMVMTAARQAGMIDAALADVLHRARVAFQDRPVDAIEARTWAERARRLQPVALSAALLQALEGRPPAERLNRDREL